MTGRRRASRVRHRVGVVGVLGELLLTAGVVALACRKESELARDAVHLLRPLKYGAQADG